MLLKYICMIIRTLNRFLKKKMHLDPGVPNDVFHNLQQRYLQSLNIPILTLRDVPNSPMGSYMQYGGAIGHACNQELAPRSPSSRSISLTLLKHYCYYCTSPRGP